ncbi:hypothetical protein [Erwinia sp. 198]|uniref:hypothetical protein n=1 Tax=Erwinia sp. 198 TaxID=2022746 RepID=UPI000F664570|nr:hypothetical protein [Erwinia sp. 198]RRZ88973.1 hypothetical protein EGK14_16950 [Erwinia sp. 198]
MRNACKIFSCLAIVAGAALISVWPWLKMGSASSAHYTERDKREYGYYTPDILKNMPRISARYDFDYANVSGPASFFAFTVKFYGTRDTREINRYLDLKGYAKQTTCFVEAACWQGQDPKEVITVGLYSEPDTVAVSVVQR